MGYAKQGQNTKGIHIRQYSRAFVFEESGSRNVFVSIDFIDNSYTSKNIRLLC